MFHHTCRDLSYWGFELLAHPLNGIMMTEFRPVSCDTHEPLRFDPGFINNTIYGDKVETGWAWFPYKQNTDNFWLPVSHSSFRLKEGKTWYICPAREHAPMGWD